ncbi:hypothetical protein SAMN02745123_00738 [Desulforamulus aeronauticus DSM 10349]|uniref:Uncharacterized protein n=1 Tax=Desulforamulus aeronauticus DSM 10349 TaxID=1121421 RepID=A0A1M6PVS5_9FIRM|nr:hypothetical protein SAMN02745123_00738 [Desulforamulus aeronauticus DSM 10349]
MGYIIILGVLSIFVFLIVFILGFLLCEMLFVNRINNLFIFKKKWCCKIFRGNPNTIYMHPTLKTIVKLKFKDNYGRKALFGIKLLRTFKFLSCGIEYKTVTHEIIKKLIENNNSIEIIRIKETRKRILREKIMILNFNNFFDKVQFYEIVFKKKLN